jgi:hypothetical protein
MIESRMRRHILIPLGLALLLLAILFAAGFYWFATAQVEEKVQSQVARVGQLFSLEWQEEARLFDNLIKLLETDPCARSAFAAKERERLLRCTEDKFRELRSKYRVTHFYFHGPDKVNFLRVHHPRRHSDRVKRFTLDQAAERGEPARGLELGTFGTFTLRVVHPWRIDGELVGYIELGEEIDHITKRLKQILGIELIFIVDKKHTTRGKWEEGQKMMGHPGDWNEYPGVVVSDRTIYLWAPELAQFTQHHHRPNQEPSFQVGAEDRHFHGNGIPLLDVANRHVGHIIVLVDATKEQAQARKLASYLAPIFVLVSGLLLAFFWIYPVRIRAALESAQVSGDSVGQENRPAEALLRQENEVLTRDVRRLQRANLEEQTLGSLLQLAQEERTIEDYLHAAMETLISSITWLDHLPEGVVFLATTEDGSDMLELAASYNFPPELSRRCAQVPFGHCLCGRVAASRTILFCNDVDERQDINFEEMVPHGHYVVPMLRDETLVGVFTLYLPQGALRDERDEFFLRKVADVLVLGIEMHRKGQLPAAAREQ